MRNDNQSKSSSRDEWRRFCVALVVTLAGIAWTPANASAADTGTVVVYPAPSEEELSNDYQVVNQYMQKQTPGYIRNVHFKNVQVTGGPGPYLVQISGADAEHVVKDTLFENVIIAGEPLAEDSPYIEIGRHSSGTRFAPKTSGDRK